MERFKRFIGIGNKEKSVYTREKNEYYSAIIQGIDKVALAYANHKNQNGKNIPIDKQNIKKILDQEDPNLSTRVYRAARNFLSKQTVVVKEAEKVEVIDANMVRIVIEEIKEKHNNVQISNQEFLHWMINSPHVPKEVPVAVFNQILKNENNVFGSISAIEIINAFTNNRENINNPTGYIGISDIESSILINKLAEEFNGQSNGQSNVIGDLQKNLDEKIKDCEDNINKNKAEINNIERDINKENIELLKYGYNSVSKPITATEGSNFHGGAYGNDSFDVVPDSEGVATNKNKSNEAEIGIGNKINSLIFNIGNLGEEMQDLKEANQKINKDITVYSLLRQKALDIQRQQQQILYEKALSSLKTLLSNSLQRMSFPKGVPTEQYLTQKAQDLVQKNLNNFLNEPVQSAENKQKEENKEEEEIKEETEENKEYTEEDKRETENAEEHIEEDHKEENNEEEIKKEDKEETEHTEEIKKEDKEDKENNEEKNVEEDFQQSVENITTNLVENALNNVNFNEVVSEVVNSSIDGAIGTIMEKERKEKDDTVRFLRSIRDTLERINLNISEQYAENQSNSSSETTDLDTTQQQTAESFELITVQDEQEFKKVKNDWLEYYLSVIRIVLNDAITDLGSNFNSEDIENLLNTFIDNLKNNQEEKAINNLKNLLDSLKLNVNPKAIDFVATSAINVLGLVQEAQEAQDFYDAIELFRNTTIEGINQIFESFETKQPEEDQKFNLEELVTAISMQKKELTEKQNGEIEKIESKPHSSQKDIVTSTTIYKISLLRKDCSQIEDEKESIVQSKQEVEKIITTKQQETLLEISSKGKRSFVLKESERMKSKKESESIIDHNFHK